MRKYEQRTGRGELVHWDFYMAYNLFRMAVILHGIAQRAHDDNANSSDALSVFDLTRNERSQGYPVNQ